MYALSDVSTYASVIEWILNIPEFLKKQCPIYKLKVRWGIVRIGNVAVALAVVSLVFAHGFFLTLAPDAFHSLSVCTLTSSCFLDQGGQDLVLGRF